MNAVRVNANMVGETLYYGAGAGALPTASAVVADIIDIARLVEADTAHRVPHLAFQPAQVRANHPAYGRNYQQLLPARPSQRRTGHAGANRRAVGTRKRVHRSLNPKGVIDQTTAEIVILTHSTVENTSSRQSQPSKHWIVWKTDYHDPHGKPA